MLKSYPARLSFRVVFFFFFTALSFLAKSQDVATGKGYFNISKGSAGGTFEAGDTIEIRATITVTNGVTIDLARFCDTLPANVSFVPGSIALMTNEGMVYQSFTDAASDDGGMFHSPKGIVKIFPAPYLVTAAAITNVNPNGGDNNSAPSISASSKPSFYGGRAIIAASYRVRINSGLPENTVISFTGGTFYYQRGGTDFEFPLRAADIILKPDLGLCANKVSNNAAVEDGGSFGSGTTQNRSTASSLVPTSGFSITNMGSGSPADGFYALANNTSANGGTDPNAPYFSGEPSRVFTVWEVGGDHTAAADPAVGNPPVAPGDSAGYMLVVNASFANGEAITQNVTSLCEENYFEFSAWFKNICRYCGCDINGNGASSGSYVPYNTGDSSGVRPNLTFEIDGESVYSTGDILFTGQWVKKGFIFRTKPGQTNFTITIRNNANGGGGNDWAMDDLSISTCGPGINVTPNTINHCNNNVVNMEATVRYFQNNYTYYLWEKSIDGGNSWSNTAETGNASSTDLGGQYEYTVGYPSFLANLADSGSQYRLRVATSASNLSSGCSFVDTTLASLVIFECGGALNTRFLQGGVERAGNTSQVRWSVEEEGISWYEIERATNGGDYQKLVRIPARGNGKQAYSWDDRMATADQYFYRIKWTGFDGVASYSPVFESSRTAAAFAIRVLTNPFQNEASLDFISPSATDLQLSCRDLRGRELFSTRLSIGSGVTRYRIEESVKWAPGIYALLIRNGIETYSVKLIRR